LALKMKRGAIYRVVYGSRHMKLAAQSARSLKRHMPRLSVSLYTNLDLPADHCFDVVKRLRNVPPGRGNNPMEAMLRSEYDSFVLLDADTWVCAPFWEVFDLVENPRVDLAAVPIRDWPRQREEFNWMYEEVGIPDAFPFFSGAFVAGQRNPRTVDFFEKWEDRYIRLSETHPVLPASHGNEPSMRVALFRCPDLRMVSLPRRYNFEQHGIPIHAVTVLHWKGREKELRSVERAVNAGAGHARAICWGEERFRL